MFSEKAKPYVVPFLTFMGLLALAELIALLSGGHGPWFVAEPLYWIYPLQTIACAALVIRYRRGVELGRNSRPLATVALGLAVLAIWVSPQAFFGAPPRTDGFDPTRWNDQPALFWLNLGLRFLRLVVVVPIIEEVFWRGFLMRYLIDARFERVPFGKYDRSSFLTVAFLFGLAHAGPDFPVALITGVLYNALAVCARSLSACIAAHALTNLGLGIYVMATRQWGFW